MAKILLSVAVVIIIAAIIIAVSTENNWKWTMITWIVLSVGATLFGIAITI